MQMSKVHSIGDYRRTSNIRRTPVGNNIVDHQLLIACRRCSNSIFIIDLIPGFNGLDEGNWKMRRGTLKVWDLVRYIRDLNVSQILCINSEISNLLQDSKHSHIQSDFTVAWPDITRYWNNTAPAKV